MTAEIKIPGVGEFFKGEFDVQPDPTKPARTDILRVLILGEPDEQGRVDIGLVSGRRIIQRNEALAKELAEGRMGNYTLTQEPPPFDLQAIFKEAGLEYNPEKGLKAVQPIRPHRYMFE